MAAVQHKLDLILLVGIDNDAAVGQSSAHEIGAGAVYGDGAAGDRDVVGVGGGGIAAEGDGKDLFIVACREVPGAEEFAAFGTGACGEDRQGQGQDETEYENGDGTFHEGHAPFVFWPDYTAQDTRTSPKSSGKTYARFTKRHRVMSRCRFRRRRESEPQRPRRRRCVR